MNATVQLYGSDGKLVTELPVPDGFITLPDVIFYGARAFYNRLMVDGARYVRQVSHGPYYECTCWRAPEPEVVEISEAG